MCKCIYMCNGIVKLIYYYVFIYYQKFFGMKCSCKSFKGKFILFDLVIGFLEFYFSKLKYLKYFIYIR